MNVSRSSILATVLVLCVAGPSQAQFVDVGAIAFPTSATGQAPQPFLRGVSILPSFGWQQAPGNSLRAKARKASRASFAHPLEPTQGPNDQ